MGFAVQDGRCVDYTPGSAVSAGAVVVQADRVGVAVRGIPANTLGVLAVEVFTFPKATGASTGIAVGTTVSLGKRHVDGDRDRDEQQAHRQGRRDRSRRGRDGARQALPVRPACPT
jgi:predicted RecA/RadA family phage recombinase